jgi:hypothetical protein
MIIREIFSLDSPGETGHEHPGQKRVTEDSHCQRATREREKPKMERKSTWKILGRILMHCTGDERIKKKIKLLKMNPYGGRSISILYGEI